MTGVAIPYSSGQVFRPGGLGGASASPLLLSQSLIHQVRFSGLRSSAECSERARNVAIPYHQVRFSGEYLAYLEKLHLAGSRNPLFIRSGFPADGLDEKWEVDRQTSQSLIHQVRFSGSSYNGTVFLGTNGRNPLFIRSVFRPPRSSGSPSTGFPCRNPLFIRSGFPALSGWKSP